MQIMSLRLRLKYKMNSIRHFTSSFYLPSWMTGTAMRVMLSLVVVVLGAAYVMETNTLATSGYEIHSLEQRISFLHSELQRLHTTVAEAQSMASIQKRLPEIQMVAVTDIIYLKLNNEVAVAK